jgi:hypothetical protein
MNAIDSRNDSLNKICNLLSRTRNGLVPAWYARRQLHDQIHLTRKLFHNNQKLEFERFAASAEEFLRTVEHQQSKFDLNSPILDKNLDEILRKHLSLNHIADS